MMQHYTYPAPVQPAAEQKKPPVVVNVLSIVSLAISAVAFLLSIAFLILTNTTVSNGDSVGVEAIPHKVQRVRCTADFSSDCTVTTTRYCMYR